MLTPLQKLEAEHNVTVFRCSWCERLFMHEADHTMYLHIELATSDTVSHGICPACAAKQPALNPHGYKIDEWRQPVCPHCGEATNKAYRTMPNLKCWNCGQPMSPAEKQKGAS